MANKLKILMCSEASYLNSGFSTYAKEILSRLHKSGKYEIAEFASYARINDPRDKDILWKFYANAIHEKDPRTSEYNSSTDNQFGKWRFERTLLDFKPDVVFDIRDYWMNSYQQRSPLRPYFHWAVMPTVDSYPQQEDWIDTYVSADAIFSYSDFGKDVLKKQSNNKIKFIETTSPGVDLESFIPMTQYKSAIRDSMNVPKDCFLVGFVARNQKRKLIPDLFESLRLLIDKKTALSEKIFLYLHTSYPDAGWDIPQLLKEYNVSNRVLFTYKCQHCVNICGQLYNGVRGICNKCGNKSLGMPSVNSGLSTKELVEIMNMFDIYVQYAICEGFGMPQVEAAACGIPIASVDYSAMNDIVHKLNGYPIRVKKLFKELETQALRAYPDNDHLIQILESYYSLPEVLKQQKRSETRSLVEKHYNWNNIAKTWEKHFDSLILTGLQGKWDSPINMLPQIPEEIVNSKIDNYNFVFGAIRQFLPGHSIIESCAPLNMIKDLEYTFVQNGLNIVPYTRKNVIDSLNNIISNHNIAQRARENIDQLPNEDWLKYSLLKEQLGKKE